MQNELNVQGTKKVYTTPVLSVHGDMVSLTLNDNLFGGGDIIFDILLPTV